MASKRKPLPFRECWLFAIASKKDLARRLSTERNIVSEVDLQRLASDSCNFKLFVNRSTNRAIQEPKPELQRLHKRVHILLSRIAVPEYLHSAIKGRSYLTNARAHEHGVPLIKIDVRKFFQSVPRAAIFRFFTDTMKCRTDAAGLLADLLTFGARLPTGSSASPVISYYAFKTMFDELHALAIRHGLSMTCYVDDITFSGLGASRAVLYKAHRIIAKHGLKSHKMRSFSARQPKIVTGVCVVSTGERVPNKLHLKIERGFDALRVADSVAEKVKLAGPLLGRLEAARQIDGKFGARAKTLRSRIRRMSSIELGS